MIHHAYLPCSSDSCFSGSEGLGRMDMEGWKEKAVDIVQDANDYEYGQEQHQNLLRKKLPQLW